MSIGERLKKAICSGDLEVLEETNFQKYGLDINSTLGSDGYSALHWACHYGRAEVLQHLMMLGADIHQVTKHGWTGAHICAIRGCTTCLNVLCNTDIDLCKPDYRGYMCLHLAAAHGKSSALQAIIKTGVSIKAVDRRGWTVLHHAAYHGRLNILQVVMGLGPNVNSTGNDGNTPAHFAAMEGHLECLKVLVYHKNKPLEVVSKRNNDGATPKDLATQFQKQDCVDFLVSAENEAEVLEYRDAEEEFPGLTAASEGNIQLLGMLLVEGHCKVNDQDNHGSTAAHKAAGNGHLDCLQLLIDHGADINVRDNAGDRPRDVAKRYAHLGCMALFTATDNDPLDNDSEDENIAQIIDTPTPQAIARASEKVEELQQLLKIAKTRYRQLGGELPEDLEIELMKADHSRNTAGYEAELESERRRREELECELDQMRKKLRESLALIEHYQTIDSFSFQSDSMITMDGSGDPTPQHHNHHHSHHSHQRPRSRSSRKSVSTGGGAFVRIGHV